MSLSSPMQQEMALTVPALDLELILDFHEVKNKLLFAMISFEFNSAMRQTLH